MYRALRPCSAQIASRLLTDPALCGCQGRSVPHLNVPWRRVRVVDRERVVLRRGVAQQLLTRLRLEHDDVTSGADVDDPNHARIRLVRMRQQHLFVKKQRNLHVRRRPSFENGFLRC